MRFIPRIDDDFTDLPLVSVEDQRSRSVVEHEFPHVNGAKLEDLGGRARRFRCLAVFSRRRYDEGRRFAEYLDANRRVSFVHPEHGLLQCRCVEQGERHDDALRRREVSFTLVEENTTASAEEAALDIVPSIERAFVQSQAEQKRRFEDALRASVGTDANDILAATIHPELPILSQLQGINVASRQVIAAIDDGLEEIAAMAPSVASPADSPLGLVTWGETIADCVIYKTAETIEAYAVSLASVRGSPSRFAELMVAAFDTLAASTDALSDVLTIGSASRAALEMAGSYELDQQNRDRVRQLEQTPAFDAQGRYVRLEPPPAIEPASQLEQSLATVHELIQRAISIDRSQRALQDSARKLTEHVERIKLELHRVITVKADYAMPLHLICTANGLPYSTADRVLALNPGIVNPSFCVGDVRIYAP